MKISLILFVGICAFVSSSSVKINPLERNIIQFGLADTIENFIKNSINEYNKIVEQLNKFAEDIEKQIDELENDAEKQIQKKIESSTLGFEIFKRNGGQIEKCIKTYQTELLETKTIALRGIRECAKPVLEAIKELTKEVLKHGVKLWGNIAELKDLVMECYNKDGFAAAKCAFKNIAAVKELIGNIISGVKDMIHTILVQKDNISEAIKLCSNNQIEIAITKMQEYNMELMKCH